MATSTNKAKNFFEQRKNAAKTATIVEAAAATEEKIETATTNEVTTQKKASGEKISNPTPTAAVPVPPDLKNFIETINYDNKININLPVKIDNRLQITLLQLKSKYGLNNRQMNKTVLLSYIIDKMLREDKFFEN
jgi:hypothetical protein